MSMSSILDSGFSFIHIKRTVDIRAREALDAGGERDDVLGC